MTEYVLYAVGDFEKNAKLSLLSALEADDSVTIVVPRIADIPHTILKFLPNKLIKEREVYLDGRKISLISGTRSIKGLGRCSDIIVGIWSIAEEAELISQTAKNSKLIIMAEYKPNELIEWSDKYKAECVISDKEIVIG